MAFKTMKPLLLSLTVLALAVSGCSVADTLPVDLPAQCLSMDISPYSVDESLVISKNGHQKAQFTVEIARDYATREQGLMCRREMAENRGMLFEFQDADQRNFWMQNTLIGLDIIYIAPDGKIVSIQKNARPLDRTPLPSKGAASGVLEIGAGLSDKLGLAAGDTVIHPFFRKPS
ncbi:MAG: DUF192 domain-containing protein [Asticcacaulis sp.]